MIIISDWAYDPDAKRYYMFHASIHDDDAFNFKHVLNCCKHNKRKVQPPNIIYDTIPTYVGGGLYVYQQFAFCNIS